jgi:hypothetical protein
MWFSLSNTSLKPRHDCRTSSMHAGRVYVLSPVVLRRAEVWDVVTAVALMPTTMNTRDTHST